MIMFRTASVAQMEVYYVINYKAMSSMEDYNVKDCFKDDNA